MNSKNFPGYIALSSVIIISLVLASLSAAIILSSYTARNSTLAATNKQQTEYAARGCLDQALLKLSSNSTYGGNESISYSASKLVNLNCSIGTITANGSNKIIPVTATINTVRTKLNLTVQASNLVRVSLQEVP